VGGVTQKTKGGISIQGGKRGDFVAHHWHRVAYSMGTDEERDVQQKQLKKQRRFRVAPETTGMHDAAFRTKLFLGLDNQGREEKKAQSCPPELRAEAKTEQQSGKGVLGKGRIKFRQVVSRGWAGGEIYGEGEKVNTW